MSFKEQFKRSGFSLMEIVLAIAIIGILLLITIPVINRQLDKADENSYYVAYKTVEKLGGQIVALGDEEENTSLLLPDSKIADEQESFGKYLAKKFDQNISNAKIFFATLGQKFAYSEIYIFRKIFPKTMAEVDVFYYPKEDDLSSSGYDSLWLKHRVCAGYQVPYQIKYKDVVEKDAEGNVVSTKKVEDGYEYYGICLDPKKCSYNQIFCGGIDRPVGAYEAYDELKSYLSSDFCANVDASSAASFIAAQETPNARAFCSRLSNYNTTIGCTTKPGTDYSSVSVTYNVEEVTDEPDDEDDEPDEIGEGEVAGIEGAMDAPASVEQGSCHMVSIQTVTVPIEKTDPPAPNPPKFYDKDCLNRGYINAYNEAGNPGSYLDCLPKPGYVPSLNDEKAFVKPCAGGVATYAKVNSTRTTATQACCTTDFNDETGVCCPEHSMYEGAGVCKCVEGYDMKGNTCVRSKCQPGSSLVDGVCVANPSLLKASRFCKKITEHWNTTESSCSGFTALDGVQYNEPVFNAAVGTNGRYLSIAAKKGAFKDITPNIVFANGLRLWILSDKAASIPGLSSTTENASGVQNACKNISLATPTAAACSAKSGYFCSNENRCYELADKTNATVKDARNCCATVDLTDYAEAAMDAGTADAYKKVSMAYAVSGFTVFVDINGDKGSGTLWEDVFPFYVGANGKVYPGYPLDAPKGKADDTPSTLYLGGNSESQLPVEVYYYEAQDTERKKVVVFPNVSYARGMCSARKISKYTPYCLNLGEKFTTDVPDKNNPSANATLEGSSYIGDDGSTSKNPCDERPCFVTVKRKLRSF